MAFSPKFGYIEGNKSLKRTAHFWINNNGDKIGVWREDWAYQLGYKILQKYPDIIWEVWRPDKRADKVYEYKFENGLITKSFPIEMISTWYGINKRKQIHSPLMETFLIDYINNNRNKQLLLVLPASRKPLAVILRKIFKYKIPILNFHGLNGAWLLGKLKSKNPFRLIHEIFKSYQYKQILKEMDNLIVAHKKYIPELKNKYNCNVYFNTIGTDINFWKSNISKDLAREKLNLMNKGHIFLFSSRLKASYLIIECLKTIKKLKKYDLYCIFTSQGETEYVNKLKKLIKRYKLEEKVFFTGYVDEEELKLLYCAADTFVSMNIANTGPMSTFIAILMEKPIITTKSGLAAEMLEENKCGMLVLPKKLKQWYNAMKFVLEGKKINILDRKIMADFVNWDNILSRWMDVFKLTIIDFNNRKIKDEESFSNRC